MKTALLIGCGSKFGLQVTTKLLSLGYRVRSLSSSDTGIINANYEQCIVKWSDLNVAKIEKFLTADFSYDIVFFNQNSSALSTNSFGDLATLELWKLEKHWAQAYFVSCILPYHVIQTIKSKLHVDTNVAWMLSSYVHTHPIDHNLGHADYIGNKNQNYLIMKNFSKAMVGKFWGINPDSLDASNHNAKADDVANLLVNNKQNGMVVFADGQVDAKYDAFKEHNGKRIQ